jgi:hypothetical protein
VKRSELFLLVLMGTAGMMIQSADAGSAVAWDGHGHFATAYGGPVQREKRRALDTARRKGWVTARIIATTDVTGYCTIAVARLGNRAIVGVALGKRSPTEAETVAVEQCLKAGGSHPKIISGWRG